MGDSFSNKNVSEIINDEYYKKIFNKENIVISKIGDEKLKLEDDLLEKFVNQLEEKLWMVLRRDGMGSKSSWT